MTVTLYNNSSENNVMNKAIASLGSYTGTLRAECSLLTPSIDIEASSITYANYMYIDEFHRYYYVDDITSVRNGLWRLSGHVDVLKTYDSAIRALPAIISRNANVYDKYLADPIYKQRANPYVITKKFPTGLTSQTLILVTMGPGGS